MPTPQKLTPLTRALMMHRAFHTRHFPAIGLALALPAMQAQAQELEFNIPAQPLTSALQEFGHQSNIQTLYNPSDMEGKRSNALNARLSPAQAIDELLQGTGIAYQLEGNAMTFLPALTGSALELGATSIVSNQLGTVSEHSRSYTPGTLATPTRMVLTPRETPQSISVITRQEMNDFNLTSIDKVMHHTPGVSVITFDSERTEYYSRGFAINEFQYDGIPMTRNSRYSAGNTLSDMAIYDRVEVLKGATGLLTGSGQPGATINLIRKKPTHDFQGHASIGAGSWDNYRTEVDASGALNEEGSIRGRAVAAYQDMHTFRDHYERQTSVYYGILEFDLTPDTLLTVGADYQDNAPKGSSWGEIRRFDSAGNFNKMPRSFNPGAQWSRWDQYTRTIFSTLEHSFANGWTGKVQLNYQINGYDAKLGAANGYRTYPDPLDGSGVTLDGWLGKYVGETESKAVDGYLSGPVEAFGREHDLVIGGSASRQELDGKNYWDDWDYPYDLNVPNYYDWKGDIPEPVWIFAKRVRETTRQNGFYAATRLNLSDDLKLILGTRLSSYDYRYSYTDPGAVPNPSKRKETGIATPYSGLIYDLSDSISVYGSYTSIFQPQSERDIDGNTLDPLDGNSYEAGIKGEFFNGRLNSSLAYFEIHQDNYAEATDQLTPTGNTAYRATQGVVSKGFELEVSGELLPNWQAHAGYTHKVARRDGDKVTTIEPEDQFSLFTTYRLSGQFEPLTLGGGARWQGKTWGNTYRPKHGMEKYTTDGYWVIDAMARYQITQDLSATLNVANLLDEKYYIPGFSDSYAYGEPRNVSANLRWDF